MHADNKREDRINSQRNYKGQVNIFRKAKRNPDLLCLPDCALIASE